LLQWQSFYAAGSSSENRYITNAEVFDPVLKMDFGSGITSSAFAHTVLTLLPEAKVMVAGGYGNEFLPVEVYDPVADNWTKAPR